MHIADLCISKAFPANENVHIHEYNYMRLGQRKLCLTCEVLQINYYHVHLKTLLSVIAEINVQVLYYTITVKPLYTYS